MELKETNKTKTPYIKPEVSVVLFSSQDVITASGNDGFDNWMDDDFTIE